PPSGRVRFATLLRALAADDQPAPRLTALYEALCASLAPGDQYVVEARRLMRSRDLIPAG
ncbi:MAG: hypothetical protein AAF772_06235, partial [Acidobacteriota bacterium]